MILPLSPVAPAPAPVMMGEGMVIAPAGGFAAMVCGPPGADGPRPPDVSFTPAADDGLRQALPVGWPFAMPSPDGEVDLVDGPVDGEGMGKRGVGEQDVEEVDSDLLTMIAVPTIAPPLPVAMLPPAFPVVGEGGLPETSASSDDGFQPRRSPSGPSPAVMLQVAEMVGATPPPSATLDFQADPDMPVEAGQVGPAPAFWREALPAFGDLPQSPQFSALVFAPAAEARAASSGAALPGAPPHVAVYTPIQQIAALVTASPAQTYEIALAPEELGRVRIHLDPADGALSVLIHADRPETLDLLRRNGEALAQDFRALGYEDVSLDFRSGSGAGGHTDAAPHAPTALQEPLPQIAVMLPEPLSALRPDMAMSVGVDLRL